MRKYRPILTATFTFHNVGQGLFYTGRFDDFRFVYDCGSTRRAHLSSIVSKYKSENLKIPKIDLLILSHLHYDHIAGLSTLLKRPRISVDTAVLPYLSPVERLMVSLRKISLPLWFYEFWADPVHYLIENGVRRILLLGGTEPSPPRELRRSEERFENREEEVDITEMPDDDLLREEVIKKDGQWKKFLDQGNLQTKSHDGYLYRRVPRGVWVFRFYNCRVKDSKLNQFERCIKPITKKLGVANVIRSRLKLRQLKKCYNLLQKDFNDTSIVVYHAPLVRERSNIYASSALGHLLTGDVNLSQKWKEVQRHFSNIFSKLSLCLVPHHGAKDNWNKAVLTAIPRKCQWIISSGISNGYGHPSFKVVQDIMQNGFPLSWSNEIHRFLTMMLL